MSVGDASASVGGGSRDGGWEDLNPWNERFPKLQVCVGEPGLLEFIMLWMVDCLRKYGQIDRRWLGVGRRSGGNTQAVLRLPIVHPRLSIQAKRGTMSPSLFSTTLRASAPQRFNSTRPTVRLPVRGSRMESPEETALVPLLSNPTKSVQPAIIQLVGSEKQATYRFSQLPELQMI